MTTMAGLRNQIVTDVNRTDATAVAETALNDAKKYYEVERWWFNERRAKYGTTPDQEHIPLPSDYMEADSVVITYNGHTYPLMSSAKLDMDSIFISGTTYTSVPERFCIYDSQIRLYPIPDATYSVTISYQYVMPDLTVSESNVWTNELGRLMRFHALADVYLNYLHNPERAQFAKQQEQMEYERAKQRNSRFLNSAPVKSWI